MFLALPKGGDITKIGRKSFKMLNVICKCSFNYFMEKQKVDRMWQCQSLTYIFTSSIPSH